MLNFVNKFSLCLLSVLFLCGLSFAKTINLYDQPDVKGKIIGSVDLSAGIIPILTPKGDWIKAADPRNGNVGWIKSNELNTGNSQIVSFTQRIINKGNIPQTYQIIQFGDQKQQLNQEQIQKIVKRMQMQHQTIQLSMHKAMQEMMRSMDDLFDTQLPIMMPVVIMPSTKTIDSPPASSKPAQQHVSESSNKTSS